MDALGRDEDSESEAMPDEDGGFETPEDVFRRHLAVVAHELRTPATVIGGLAAMLADQRSSFTEEGLDEALASLRRQSDRLIRLLGSLLEVSAVHVGDLDVTLEAVAVEDVIASAVIAAAPPPAVAVSTDIERRLHVLADWDRLEQVLVNLLSNAVRYGGTSVEVQGRAAHGWTEIAVVDSGPGVSDEEAPHLFEAFFQGAGSASGSGLGLYIARGLVEAMGGRLEYEPNEPTGARFVVRLRPPSEAPRLERNESTEPAVDQEPGRPPRILVVDDEPDTLFLLRAILRSAGYDVVSAWNGREALDRLGEAAFDAVLTDQMMPTMGGRELIERMRSDPRTEGIPVLMISAAPVAGVPADATLRKPFRPGQVLELVNGLLAGGG